MKSRLLPLVALCIASSAATARADIAWENDYATARAKSQATGKPLFIDVYTDWCGWCKKVDSDIYPDPRVQQLAGSFIMLKLNAEREGAPFAQMMKVTGYPSLMFVSTRGELFSRRGYVEPNTFVSLMSDTLRRNGPIRASHTVTPTRKVTVAPPRMSLKAGTSNWKKQPELKRAVSGAGYGGALLLGDDGIVKVDQPATKKKLQKAKSRTRR